MIQCFTCENNYPSNKKSCSRCGYMPEKIDNFLSWSPESAYNSNGFKSEAFAQLAKLEGKNFWFRARNKIILFMIAKYFPSFQSFLEIGCGTGFVLSAISKKYPSAQFVGSEIFVKGLTFAAQRVPSATCVQMDATKIPYIKEFDLIGAFDVLEHIKKDEIVLGNMFKALQPGGGMIISVPQHQWLWSQVDVFACHERRYSNKDIESKVKAAGFEILRSTSFVSFLLPAMLLSRSRGQNGSGYDPLEEFKIHPLLNRILEGVLSFERLFIRMGFDFPIGGSRLLVVRKPIV